MNGLPVGTVTFLFTDIEGSTMLLQEFGDQYREILEVHNSVLREAFTRAGGYEVRTEGDAFFEVFPSAWGAVVAVAEAQRKLAAAKWPGGADVRVRMGLHTGQAQLGGDNYFGLDVHRAARIAAAGHGGQVLLSKATAVLVAEQLPPGVGMTSLGQHRLKDLSEPEHLFQLEVEGLSSVFPPLASLDASPNNLPAPLTSFVGREQQVKEVADRLATTRLLTLTGPGGTGKTRLSLQVATEMVGRYRDGVFFVELASIFEPALIAAEVSTAVGLRQTPVDPDDRLRKYLADKQMLLVLDNFEQLLEAAPRLTGWLRDSPELRLMVSSRAPLRVSGEQEYPVPPLALPASDDLLDPALIVQNEAVALFVERAKAARPNFILDRDNVDAVVGIVSRLEGLPLAIELAAARINVLTAEGILGRLSSSLSLLTTGSRDLTERQRTMRGAIAWSHDLLTAPVQRLFAQMAVFVGGASLTQLEEVCDMEPGDGIDLLDGLEMVVDHSLIRRTDQFDEPRFTMMQPIHDFAAEQLEKSGELQRMRQRHAAAFEQLALEASPHLVQSDSRRWLDRLELDLDNMRAALSFALEEEAADVANGMVGSLWRFWQRRGHVHEGRTRAAAALQLSPINPTAHLRSLEAAGGLAYWQGEPEKAMAHYQEAVVLARALSDRRELGQALYNLSFPLGFPEWGGELDEALRMLDEAIAIGREVDDSELIGKAIWAQATLRHANSQLAGVEELYTQSLEILAGTHDVFMVGWAYRMRAGLRIEQGDPARAQSDLKEALNIFVEAGDISALALLMRDFAMLAIHRKDHDTALRMAGAMFAIEQIGQIESFDLVVNRLHGLDRVIEAVGKEKAEKLIEEGRGMSVSEALELVRQATD